jgi:ribosomal protein S27AE
MSRVKQLFLSLPELVKPLGMTCPNGQCGGTMTKSGDVYVCPKCGYTM